MTYAEARKVLKKVGTSRASGAALCAMYARLISYQACLDGPKGNGYTTKAIYAHLCAWSDDAAISQEALRLLRDPLEAGKVAFPD